MSVLPIETRLVTLLNVILLILVAIIPYLFEQAVSLINTPDVQNYASILFTFDYSGSLFIMAGFAHLIAQEEKQLVHNDQIIRFQRIRNRLTVLTIIVLFSPAVPWDWFFLGAHVRLLMGLVPIVSFWFYRMQANAPGWRSPTAKPL